MATTEQVGTTAETKNDGVRQKTAASGPQRDRRPLRTPPARRDRVPRRLLSVRPARGIPWFASPLPRRSGEGFVRVRSPCFREFREDRRPSVGSAPRFTACGPTRRCPGQPGGQVCAESGDAAAATPAAAAKAGGHGTAPAAAGAAASASAASGPLLPRPLLPVLPRRCPRPSLRLPLPRRLRPRPPMPSPPSTPASEPERTASAPRCLPPPRRRTRGPRPPPHSAPDHRTDPEPDRPSRPTSSRVRARLARLGSTRSGGPPPVLEPLFKIIRANHPKADLKPVEQAYVSRRALAPRAAAQVRRPVHHAPAGGHHDPGRARHGRADAVRGAAARHRRGHRLLPRHAARGLRRHRRAAGRRRHQAGQGQARARPRRPRPCARWSWPWPATSACWSSSSPTGCTTCAPCAT